MEPGITSARRFYLLKRRAAAELDQPGLASVWQTRQLAESGTDLPSNFPARALLVAAGYLAIEDVTGADEDELLELGLSGDQVAAVLKALG